MLQHAVRSDQRIGWYLRETPAATNARAGDRCCATAFARETREVNPGLTFARFLKLVGYQRVGAETASGIPVSGVGSRLGDVSDRTACRNGFILLARETVRESGPGPLFDAAGGNIGGAPPPPPNIGSGVGPMGPPPPAS